MVVKLNLYRLTFGKQCFNFITLFFAVSFSMLNLRGLASEYGG